MPQVSAVNLHKTFVSGQDVVVEALRGVSFDVAAGEFVALMGPSGCGKSTLLHLIGGMDKPSEGSVFCGETQVDSLQESELDHYRRCEVGFVFQFFNLLPTLTVHENTALPLLLMGKTKTDVSDLVGQTLDRVGMTHRAQVFPASLSGGEMQRVAAARAIIAEPKILLADEPTGSLDSENGFRLLELFGKLNDELSLTILMATHSQEAASFATRTLKLRDGVLEGERHAALS